MFVDPSQDGIHSPATARQDGRDCSFQSSFSGAKFCTLFRASFLLFMGLNLICPYVCPSRSCLAARQDSQAYTPSLTKISFTKSESTNTTMKHFSTLLTLALATTNIALSVPYSLSTGWDGIWNGKSFQSARLY